MPIKVKVWAALRDHGKEISKRVETEILLASNDNGDGIMFTGADFDSLEVNRYFALATDVAFFTGPTTGEVLFARDISSYNLRYGETLTFAIHP